MKTPNLSIALRTTYTCLLGVSPTPIGLGTRDMTCVHEHKYSFLFLTQPHQTYFFVFSKLLHPITQPEQAHWTPQDAEKIAEEVKIHPIGDESLLFGELWKTRVRGQLVSIEEGILPHWHFGRIILAGDAAHKVTPNFALGGNAGIESVTVLTNCLHKMLLLHSPPHSTQKRPSKAAITAAFQQYQDQRMPRVRKVYLISWFITRLQAFDGVFMRCVAQWLVPNVIGDARIADQLGYLVRNAPKLNFIPIESRRGTMGWKDDEMLLKGGRYSRPRAIRAVAAVLILVGLWWLWTNFIPYLA